MKPALAAIVFLGVTAAPAGAQTLGTVFGPEVDPEDRAAQYRFAMADEGGGASDRAHRLHVQRAFSGSLRLRGVLTYSDAAGAGLEPDHIQGELLWQVVQRSPGGYSSGLRFDARLAEGDDTPHEIGFNWTNQWALGEGWRARAVLLLDRDIGPDSRDDVFVETRASLSRKLDNGLRIGLDSFNDYGGLDAGFGDFDDQSHQLGLSLGGDFGESWGWSVMALGGLSEGAPDSDLAIRIGRSFAPASAGQPRQPAVRGRAARP